MSDSYRDTVREHSSIIAVLTVFTATQLYLLAHIWQQPPLWDTAIYIAMGKALFSGGSLGFWESYRPPVLPILLGFLWRTGVPVIGTTRLISLIIAVAGTAAMYTGIKQLYSRQEAVYAAGLLLGSWIFYSFSSNLLTGIPASFLLIGSLLLLREDRYIAAGLLASVAFLTRFPAALVGPAAVAYLLAQGYRTDRFRDSIKNAALYTGAFAVPAIAYLLANHLILGSALEPFIRSIKITTPGRPTYIYGLYYLKEAVIANPFFLALPVGIAAILRERDWSYGPFLAAFLILYSFFTSFPLKIPRYTLLFLPLMALLAARGITAVQQIVTERWAITDRQCRLLIVLGLAVVTLGSFTVTYGQKTVENPAQQAFYDQASRLTGVVASNDPVTAAYGDFVYEPLPPGYLEGQRKDMQGVASYYAINGCAWYCTPSIENCERRIDSFEQTIAEEHTKIFARNSSTCTYTVYSTGE